MNIDNKYTFVEAFKLGLVNEDDIDYYVEEWHNKKSNQKLSDFLGMNEQDYYKWVNEGNKVLHKIYQKEYVYANKKIAKELIKIAKELVVDDNLEKIKQIASEVRQIMVKKYGKGNNLSGHCVQASDLIIEKLKQVGITKIKSPNGYCLLDENCGFEYPYDDHVWVEACGYYIDVTAEQFNDYLSERDEQFPPICIFKKRPRCMALRKPLLDSDGYFI